MKKIAMILALVLCLSILTACGGNEAAPAVTAPEGTSEELINKVYENVTVELSLMTMPIDIADLETLTWLTSLESAEGLVDAAINEPMMGSQAYSMVMVRTESAEKAAEVAQHMFDNIDMGKWICVRATEKQAVICDNLVMFIMLDPQYGVTTDQIVEAFTTVCGGTVSSIIK